MSRVQCRFMGERERAVRPEEMATTSTATTTVPPQIAEEPVERVAVITLRAPRTQQRKKVVWTEDTIDNEHMNKKKSKCCCIYEKPHKFGESDSEDSDDECEHCSGHVEKRKAKKSGNHQHCEQPADGGSSSSCTVQEEAPPHEPTASLTLKTEEPSPAPAPPDKDNNIPQ